MIRVSAVGPQADHVMENKTNVDQLGCFFQTHCDNIENTPKTSFTEKTYEHEINCCHETGHTFLEKNTSLYSCLTSTSLNIFSNIVLPLYN